MTIQCCVCKKTKMDDDWRNQPVAAGQDISHTYCPTCLIETVTALATERSSAGVPEAFIHA